MILPAKRHRENNGLHRCFYSIWRGLAIVLYHSPLFVYFCHNMGADSQVVFLIESPYSKHVFKCVGILPKGHYCHGVVFQVIQPSCFRRCLSMLLESRKKQKLQDSIGHFLLVLIKGNWCHRCHSATGWLMVCHRNLCPTKSETPSIYLRREKGYSGSKVVWNRRLRTSGLRKLMRED